MPATDLSSCNGAEGCHSTRLRIRYRRPLPRRYFPYASARVRRGYTHNSKCFSIDYVDVGCGHRHSTVLMAQAYPSSRCYGYDPHEESIAAARKNAVEAGVADRVTIVTATTTDDTTTAST